MTTDTATQVRPEQDRKGEHHELIASDRVEGTAVYNPQGERLGTIHHFMVGKRDGRVRYAVMSFGGFLGMGADHYPLPWDVLDYDTEKEGYVVALDKDKLTGGPSYKPESRPDYDPEYGRTVYTYYGLIY